MVEILLGVSVLSALLVKLAGVLGLYQNELIVNLDILSRLNPRLREVFAIVAPTALDIFLVGCIVTLVVAVRKLRNSLRYIETIKDIKLLLNSVPIKFIL